LSDAWDDAELLPALDELELEEEDDVWADVEDDDDEEDDAA
jgi:hypothetical protein